MENKSKTMTVIISALVCIAVFAAGVYAVFLIRNNGKDAVDTSSTKPVNTVSSEPEQTVSDTSSEDTVSNTSSKDTVSVQEYTATMYTTSKDLNVRSEPNSNNAPIGTLALGTAVSVTGKCANGWYQISYNGKTAYCYGAYLSTEKKDTSTNNTPQSTATYHIKINRAQSMLIIYKKDDNGEYTVPVKAMVCSVGRQGHETPTGNYKLTDKYTWACLSGNVWGQYVTRITGPYLFHSVPYFTKNKSNLEYEEYNKLGQPASKGCVRLSVIDAKWIFDNCAKGTTVSIYDSSAIEPLAKPTPIKIDVNDSRKGWDPTDPDPNNPWKK